MVSVFTLPNTSICLFRYHSPHHLPTVHLEPQHLHLSIHPLDLLGEPLIPFDDASLLYLSTQLLIACHLSQHLVHPIISEFLETRHDLKVELLLFLLSREDPRVLQ